MIGPAQLNYSTRARALKRLEGQLWAVFSPGSPRSYWLAIAAAATVGASKVNLFISLYTKSEETSWVSPVECRAACGLILTGACCMCTKSQSHFVFRGQIGIKEWIQWCLGLESSPALLQLPVPSSCCCWGSRWRQRKKPGWDFRNVLHLMVL